MFCNGVYKPFPMTYHNPTLDQYLKISIIVSQSGFRLLILREPLSVYGSHFQFTGATFSLRELQGKLDKEEVVALIEEKQERDNIVVTKQQEKQIMDFVKKGIYIKADIVKEQLPKDSVNKDDIRVIIDGKFEENEKLASDRQSRERNIVIFRMDEPQTNLVIERQANNNNNTLFQTIVHMDNNKKKKYNVE